MGTKFLVSIQGMEDAFSTANNNFERFELGEWDAEQLLPALQRFASIDFRIITGFRRKCSSRLIFSGIR